MYTSNDSKNLASIKSRMGWQVGLQAGTLMAISGLNSTVKNQTEIITNELQDIKDSNIEGFKDIESALNSLEFSLISGFEDLKWFLGSIDDKLAKIIGLVEFPKSTESTEQYLFGMELYKQKYFDKAIISFNSSIEKNPVNLNAKVGLYLAIKENDKKEDLQLLEEIIYLTKSNFTLNLNVSDQAKNNSIIFFSNFVFNELASLGKYDKILDYFENHLLDIAKQQLNIKIKYLASKINMGGDYNLELRNFIEEGNLMNLLCFVEYKKDEKFVIFLRKTIDIIRETFNQFQTLEFSNKDEIGIIRAASFLIEKLNDEKQLILLGSANKTLAFKNSILSNFFAKAQESKNIYESEKLKLKTIEMSVEKLKNNKGIVFQKEENSFLIKSNRIIQNKINEKLNNFKTDSLKNLKNAEKKQKKQLKCFADNYPALLEEEQSSYNSIVIIMKSLGYWNSSKGNKKNNFNFFEEIQSMNDILLSEEKLRNTVLELVKIHGELATVKIVKDKLGLGLKEAKEYVKKYTI